MQVNRIARQIEMDGIRCANSKGASTLSSVTLHLDLIPAQRNVHALCLFVQHVANIVFGLAGIGFERGFGLHNVLELIVFVINRDQFRSEINPRDNYADAKDKFDRPHRALPAQARHADAISAQAIKL
jgi:hypothetical protein